MTKKTCFCMLTAAALTGFFWSLCMSTVRVVAYSASISTNGSVMLDVAPTGDGVSIQADSVSVTSDCRAGYNLAAVVPNGSSLYKYDNGVQASETATFTAVDGVSALNNSNNTDKWGYTLAPNPTGSTVFSPLSTTAVYLKTSVQTASADSDIDDTFSVYYGVQADDSVEAGSYKMNNDGTIVYYLTMDINCTPYTLQYDGNGADNTNGMGAPNPVSGYNTVNQIGFDTGTEVTLLAPNFKKAGYGFLGWSFDKDAYNHFTDNDNNNDPVIYGPNETLEITSSILALANEDRVITMHAVWIPALKNGNNPVYLQYWDNPNTASVAYDGCSTLTAATYNANPGAGERPVSITKSGVVALTDMRDNEVYTVAKLADGNCWMVDNLRLNDQYTVGQNQNDSTLTNESLAQGYGKDSDNYFGYGEFVGLASSESANFTSSSDMANSVYYSDVPTGTATVNIGNEEAAYHFPRYNNNNTTNSETAPVFTQDYTNPASPTPSGFNANVYAYGNYYSWAAALADTYYFGKDNIYADDQNTSICPKGWYVPSSSGARDVDYGALSQAYGGTGNNQASSAGGGVMSKKIRMFPNNFMYSGSIGGSTFYRGQEGNYISSSNASNLSGYQPLLFSSTQFNPKNYRANNRTYGFSIRCAAANYLTLTVTLDHVSSVTFSNPEYGSQTLTASGTVSLKQSVNYSVSYVYPVGYEGNNTPVVSYYDDASFNFVGVENPYRIQYDGNGADNPTGMGVADAEGKKQISHYLGESGSAIGTEETLLASNFKRAGYGFLGWSTDLYAAEHWIDGDSTNDPTIYGPNETIEITSSLLAEADPSNHVITLYAVWIPSAGYMQDYPCNDRSRVSYNGTTLNVTAASVIALTDKRDNETYAVARLADGHCWMIENLRLDDQYTYGVNQNDNTVSNSLLAQGYGSSSSDKFIGLSASESDNFTSSSIASNCIYYMRGYSPMSCSYIIPEIVEISDQQELARYLFPRYNNNNTHNSIDGMNFSGKYNSQNLYSYGNYYTWAAAMANTGMLATSSDSEAASTSICPRGWILPASGVGSLMSFGALSLSYGGNGGSQSGNDGGQELSRLFRKFPNNYIYSGYYGIDTALNRGSNGYYWTTSAYNPGIAKALWIGSGAIKSSSVLSNSKSHGFSIRCVRAWSGQ